MDRRGSPVWCCATRTCPYGPLRGRLPPQGKRESTCPPPPMGRTGGEATRLGASGCDLASRTVGRPTDARRGTCLASQRTRRAPRGRLVRSEGAGDLGQTYTFVALTADGRSPFLDVRVFEHARGAGGPCAQAAGRAPQLRPGRGLGRLRPAAGDWPRRPRPGRGRAGPKPYFLPSTTWVVGRSSPADSSSRQRPRSSS